MPPNCCWLLWSESGFTTDLPSPSPAPLAIGIGTGLITLLGFTLPAVVRLGSVPPLRVLRRDLKGYTHRKLDSGAVRIFRPRPANVVAGARGQIGAAGSGGYLFLALLLSAARLLVAILTPCAITVVPSGVMVLWDWRAIR